MRAFVRRPLAACVVIAFLCATAKPAKATSLDNLALEISLAIAATGAAIGIGIYVLVRQDQSITGCAVSNSTGLQLKTEGDSQTFGLMGDISSINAGDRVRVSGKKKKKKDAAGNRQFLVEKVSKHLGACKVAPANP
jgi:hypothetical protein